MALFSQFFDFFVKFNKLFFKIHLSLYLFIAFYISFLHLSKLILFLLNVILKLFLLCFVFFGINIHFIRNILFESEIFQLDIPLKISKRKISFFIINIFHFSHQKLISFILTFLEKFQYLL